VLAAFFGGAQGAATSGVTGRLEDVYLQRAMELLGQKNSLVGLTGVPTNLDGFPECDLLLQGSAHL
jgi:hypothetical protein